VIGDVHIFHRIEGYIHRQTDSRHVGARPSPVMEFSPLPANVVMMLFVSTRRIRRLLESAK
jgi:hypothetical protein